MNRRQWLTSSAAALAGLCVAPFARRTATATPEPQTKVVPPPERIAYMHGSSGKPIVTMYVTEWTCLPGVEPRTYTQTLEWHEDGRVWVPAGEGA